MAAKNDITGDSIQSRVASDKYREEFDRIFGKKEKKSESESKLPDLDISDNPSAETSSND